MSNNISNIHLGLLDQDRLEVLQKLHPLALQLNHRKSFDFDFFSSTQISKKLLEKLSTVSPIENIVVDTLDELTFFTTNEVKITFLYYPLLPTPNEVKRYLESLVKTYIK